MSYSYLNSVFPDFKNTSYDLRISKYKQAPSLASEFKTIEEFKTMESLEEQPIGTQPPEILPPEEVPLQEQTPEENSQQNMPPSLPVESPQKKELETTLPLEDQHSIYLNHILSCQRCTFIIIKQLKLQEMRIYKNNILEFLSYLLFTLFVVMILYFIKYK